MKTNGMWDIATRGGYTPYNLPSIKRGLLNCSTTTIRSRPIGLRLDIYFPCSMPRAELRKTGNKKKTRYVMKRLTKNQPTVGTLTIASLVLETKINTFSFSRAHANVASN